MVGLRGDGPSDCVRPYTSVYWNVDVLYRLYPYILSPYSPPTQIPYCMHSPILYSYSATFTRNTACSYTHLLLCYLY